MWKVHDDTVPAYGLNLHGITACKTGLRWTLLLCSGAQFDESTVESGLDEDDGAVAQRGARHGPSGATLRRRSARGRQTQRPDPDAHHGEQIDTEGASPGTASNSSAVQKHVVATVPAEKDALIKNSCFHRQQRNFLFMPW